MSLYDTKGSHFVTEPIGPFEDPNVHDQPTAQEHFTSNREIKLKDPRGDPLPNPSYRLVGGGHYVGHADVGIRKGRVIAPEARRCHAMMKQAIHLPIYCGRSLTAILSLCIHACPCRDHYPPHAFPEREKGLELNPGIFPFTARTEHMDQYFEKPRMPRPAEPLSHTPQPLPWTGKETSNQAHYKPFVFAPKEEAVPAPSGRLPTAPPSTDPTDWVGMEITLDHLESHHHAA